MLDRSVRDCVFGPLVLLCAPRADGFEQMLFPQPALAKLWRVMKQTASRTVSVALASLTTGMDSDTFPPCYDQLCREAARGLREREAPYLPVIAMLEEFRPGASAEFISCLLVAPLARSAAPRLTGWIRHMNNEHAAAVRLMFKDAAAAVEDGTPKLMEMLMAQLKEPWLILRMISAVTGRASDRYLASSEMASFCQRVLAVIDDHLNQLRIFDLDGGPEAAVAAAQHVALAATQAAEVEAAMEMEKQGPWGARLAKQRGLVASLTEGHLKKCGKLVSEALPVQPARAGGLRPEPLLEMAPDTRLVRRAMAGLTFFDRVRGPAATGGYGTVRAKVCEDITYGLDGYLEDILAIVHDGDPAEAPVARTYLEVGADFMGLLHDIKAAQIIRRRAAAA